MKNEAEVDETATKWKKSGSTISAYMEQKLDKKAKNIFIYRKQQSIWTEISGKSSKKRVVGFDENPVTLL